MIPFDPPYNYDVLSMWDTRSFVQALKGKVVISSAYLFADPDDPVAVAEAEQMAGWFKDFIPPEENAMEPLSEVYVPIIDQTQSVVVDPGDAKDPGKCLVMFSRSLASLSNPFALQLEFSPVPGIGAIS